jgi:hypothetical protein
MLCLLQRLGVTRCGAPPQHAIHYLPGLVSDPRWLTAAFAILAAAFVAASWPPLPPTRPDRTDPADTPKDYPVTTGSPLTSLRTAGIAAARVVAITLGALVAAIVRALAGLVLLGSATIGRPVLGRRIGTPAEGAHGPERRPR